MAIDPKVAKTECDLNLDAAANDAFARALAAPAEPNDALRDLMAAKAPWE